MPNLYQIGRLGRVYFAEEPAYGTAPTLAAGDALRHLNVKFGSKLKNRVNSPERHAHPSQINRFTRRQSADWMVSGILYPSGTLNTVSDVAPVLKTTLGATSNVTLSTTVAASPLPSSTVFTLASVTGLVVGQPILINATSGGRQVRWITAISGAAVTVAPALSAAPASGDAVKGCVGYSLTTALGASVAMAHYLTSVSYEIKGGAPDMLKLDFDANDEPQFEASGPAKSRTRPAQADPATFTTSGTTPPSGLTGYLRVGAAAEEFLKASFSIKNGIELDNKAFGTSAAAAMFRNTKREVTVNLETMVSDDVTILDKSEDQSDNVLLMQCGLTEGSIWAVYCPKVEFEEPEDSNNAETMTHSFTGVCKGTAGNDEIYIAEA